MTDRVDALTLYRRARAHRDRMIARLLARLIRRLTGFVSGREGRRPIRTGYRLG